MPRRRVAVALIPAPVLADRVDTLRRAVGVPEPFHVPPHLTLVAPVNIRDDDLGAVRAVLRAAAAAARALELRIGPAATFAPESPTLHLAVRDGHGTSAPSAPLAALRDAVRTGPLERDDPWPFVAHVTLAESFPPDRIPGAVRLLAGVDEPWIATSVHLLEQRRRADGSPVWVPVREEPLGGPVVVGRGGIETVLRVAGMVEDDVAMLCAVPPLGPVALPGGPAPLVVVAEGVGRGGVPVAAVVGPVIGAAVGSAAPGGVASLDRLFVQPGRRGEGVGRHLLAAWCSAAADRGASLVVAQDDDLAGDDAFLVRHGFSAAGDVLVRSLG